MEILYRTFCTIKGSSKVLIYFNATLFFLITESSSTLFAQNNDGKNDILKPVLLGNVKQYQFWIYNRWGQVVFHSVDLSKGWDGTYKQLNQDGNVFVWVCTYQFESEPLQGRKELLF
jgi:gliding motility-associated-like protein